MVIASFEIFGPSKFNVRNGSYNLKRDTLGFHIIPVSYLFGLKKSDRNIWTLHKKGEVKSMS